MSTLQPEMQQIWHLMNINKPKFSPGVQARPTVPPPILFSKSAPGVELRVFCATWRAQYSAQGFDTRRSTILEHYL